jgi:hypothetical protein
MSGRAVYLPAGQEMPGAFLRANSQITIGGQQYSRSLTIETDGEGGYEFSGLRIGSTGGVEFDPWGQPSMGAYSDSDVYDSAYAGGFKVREGRSVYRVNVFVDVPQFIDDGESGGGDGTGSWSGVVANDGTAIDRCAELFVQSDDSSFRGQTDSCSGAFELSNLPNGTYEVLIDAYESGVAFAEFSINDANQFADSGQIEFIEFPDPDSSITFAADDGAGNSLAQEITGVELTPVSIEGISGETIEKIETFGIDDQSFFDRFYDSNWWVDDSGLVNVDNLRAGEYRLRVSFGESYSEENLDFGWEQPREIDVTVGAGNTVLNDIQSKRIDARGDVLLVKVKDSESRVGVSGVNCYLYGVSAETAPVSVRHNVTATTGADGVATFDRVLRGQSYDINCNGWGDRFGTGIKRNAVSVAAGVTKFAMAIDFLYPDATVAGRVVDKDGEPIEGIRVAAEFVFHYPDCRCGDGFGIVDYTDENGNYFLDDVLSGSSGSIRAFDQSRTFADWGISLANVEPGDQQLADIVMKPGKPIAGSVVDRNAEPLAAEVSLESTNGLFDAWGSSDSTGSIAFNRSIPVGAYIVRASVDDSWQLGGHTDRKSVV